MDASPAILRCLLGSPRVLVEYVDSVVHLGDVEEGQRAVDNLGIAAQTAQDRPQHVILALWQGDRVVFQAGLPPVKLDASPSKKGPSSFITTREAMVRR